LRSVVEDLPKPMAPVKGKPFLQYVLGWMANGGVGHAVLSVGYRWETIHSHFGDRFQEMDLSYSVEETPLGTGGAVALAMGHTSEKTILVVNGDTIFPIDLRRLLDLQADRGQGATIALKRMREFDRYGSVALSGDKIHSFLERSFRTEGLINAGIYAMDRNFLGGRGLPERFSLEKEILEKEAGGDSLFGAEFEAPFLDIGIPEDYARAGDFI